MPQCFKCLQHLMTYYILINIIHGAAAVVVRPFVGSKFWNIQFVSHRPCGAKVSGSKDPSDTAPWIAA